MHESKTFLEQASPIVGSIIITWGHIERGVDDTLDDLYTNWFDHQNSPKRPRVFSQKIKLLRKFFNTHPDWKDVLSEVVESICNDLDDLADIRNALSHGVVLEPQKPNDSDVRVLVRSKQVDSKDIVVFSFRWEELEGVGKSMYKAALFINALPEVLSGEFGSEKSLHDLIKTVVS